MRPLGYASMVAAAAAWSTNGVASRLAFDAGWSPTHLAAIRVAGAAVILAPFALPALRRLSRRDLGAVTLFGAIGIVMAQWLYYEAISRIDIAVALVIIYLGPALVAVYQRTLHGERLPGRAVAGIALAIGGVAASVLGAGGDHRGVSLVGLGLALGGTVAFAVQMVLAGRQTTAVSPIATTGVAMAVASLVWLVSGVLTSVPFDRLDDQASLGPRIGGTAPSVVLVGWVVVVPTLIAYVLLVVGSARVGAGAASVVSMLEPAVAGILAWWLLGQSLTAVQMVGIATALVGIVIAERYRLAPGVGVGAGRAEGVPTARAL